MQGFAVVAIERDRKYLLRKGRAEEGVFQHFFEIVIISEGAYSRTEQNDLAIGRRQLGEGAVRPARGARQQVITKQFLSHRPVGEYRMGRVQAADRTRRATKQLSHESHA